MSSVTFSDLTELILYNSEAQFGSNVGLPFPIARRFEISPFVIESQFIPRRRKTTGVHADMCQITESRPHG
jgi:hypothetical protein